MLKLDLITIGDELLLGLRTNRHLSWIGEQISRRGLMMRRNLVISDNAAEIQSTFQTCWADADLVITTGGLGPTSDDRTREVIARALGKSLVHDEAIERAIAERFAQMGRTMVPSNLKQALKPEGATVLPNPNGTAPGLWIEEKGKVLIMLPGPSQECYPMFQNEVLPRLEARQILVSEDSFFELRTAGVGESILEHTLAPFREQHPEVEFAYCAFDGVVDVRLSLPDRSLPTEHLRKVAEQCREFLGDDFVGFGQPLLSKVIHEALREKGHSVSVAESCTGGLLANAFTDIPGSSKTFAGGVVCYNNDAKVQMLGVPECMLSQHGAVSAETAVAMAAGAAERFATEYALSVTGFAGPGGGTSEYPVGTIFIGLHSPDGIWSKKCLFTGTRITVKRRSVNTALDWLRREATL